MRLAVGGVKDGSEETPGGGLGLLGSAVGLDQILSDAAVGVSSAVTR